MKKTLSKILITTDPFGGIWTYTLELCRYLEKENIEVVLAVTGALCSEFQRKEIKELSNVHLHEKAYKLEWMNNPWKDIESAGAWLLQLEAKYSPDIIHLNSYSYASLNWRAPVVVAGHSCKLTWWKSVKRTSPPPEWSEYYLRVYNGLHAADFVIAPSRYMLQSLNIIYGDFLNQSVIYHGRDKTQFTAHSKKLEQIVTAGKIWDEAKNIKSVIDASPRFNWKVCVAGNNVSAIINEEADKSNVNFTGYLSDFKMAELLSNSYIFMLPAKYEPFGLTPLEAAISGCALILGKTASLIEVWEDSALYVTSGDIEELVFVTNYLINNKDLLHSYSLKAYKMSRHYSSIKMGTAYLSLYMRVIKSKQQKHRAVI